MAREQRGVSLESMCASTKLSLSQLLNVEAGNFRDLPGGVFRKGFVRSYLNALELDEPFWLERFEQSYRASGLADASDADWAGFAENVSNNRNGKKASRLDGRWIGVVLMVLGVLLLTFFTWKIVIEPRYLRSSGLHSSSMMLRSCFGS